MVIVTWLETIREYNALIIAAIKSRFGRDCGDNFNAGLLFALHRLNVSRAGLVKLEASAWDEAISRAIAFAQNVCQSYENFISADFAQNILDIAF